MNYLPAMALGLLLSTGSAALAASNNAMIDAMQAMVDAMADYVDSKRGRERSFGDLFGRGMERLYNEEHNDLLILYRNMPGAPPRSAASRTQLLDGIWMGRRGEILMIRDGVVRIFAYSHAHFEDAEIYIDPPRLQIRNIDSGVLREYDYAYRAGRLVLRGQQGNILLYRRLSSEDRFTKPLTR
jgi:hypothetical protein